VRHRFLRPSGEAQAGARIAHGAAQHNTISPAHASVSGRCPDFISPPKPSRVIKLPGSGGRAKERRLRTLISWYRIAVDAFMALGRDDGWAIASHIALSTLMSLFPFLIFVTALTGFLFGTEELADQVAGIILEAWPKEVAEPIASQVANVLTTAHSGPLTFGVIASIYFSSSGIESLRIGLNRAYDEIEMRPWWVLRLESIAYVLVGAAGLITLAFLIVLAPLIFHTALRYAPWLSGMEGLFTFARFGIATVVLVVALLLVHKWLPYGRRRLVDIAPGIVVTLIGWIVMGVAFGRYLAQFSANYVTTYAGLASAMIALVFLYWTAGIFIYGGEINQAVRKARAGRKGKVLGSKAMDASETLTPP
jgi:membrane protein